MAQSAWSKQPADETPRLSVAIVVRNDAAGLATTLASVATVADEIVVLDTGTRPQIAELCRNAGARRFARLWDDDFSAARNACSEHCTGDWILWVDSGECLANDSADALHNLLRAADGAAAYRVTVRIPPETADGSPEQLAPVRLVPRRARLRFVGRVRESLATSLEKAQLRCELAPIALERSTREHAADRKQQRARRDLLLADMDIARRGPIPWSLVAKGEALVTLGRHAEAIDALREAIGNSPEQSPARLAAYYALLATLDELATRTAEAIQARISVALEALEQFPLDAQLLLAMGGYLQAQGQIELAARSFRLAWEHGSVTADVWHLSEARALAASCLSVALQIVGRDEEAERALIVAVEHEPHSRRLRRRLLELFVKQNRRDRAYEQVDALGLAADEHTAMRAAVRGACLAAARNWIAALPHLEAAYTKGCRDMLLRRALVTTLLATKQTDRAERLTLEWLSDLPRDAEAARFLAALREPSAGDATRTDGPTTPKRPQVRIDVGPQIGAAPMADPIFPPHVPATSSPLKNAIEE